MAEKHPPIEKRGGYSPQGSGDTPQKAPPKPADSGQAKPTSNSKKE